MEDLGGALRPGRCQGGEKRVPGLVLLGWRRSQNLREGAAGSSSGPKGSLGVDARWQVVGEAGEVRACGAGWAVP